MSSETWSRRKAIGVGGAVVGGAWIAPHLISTPAAAAQSVTSRWVAAGGRPQEGGVVWTSPEGANWATVATFPQQGANAVATDGQGRWLAVGDGAWTSLDTVTWSATTSSLPSDSESVATDGTGTWIAPGHDFQAFEPMVMVTTDLGATWFTIVLEPTGFAVAVASDGNGRWVVVGDQMEGMGGVWLSTDAFATTIPTVVPEGFSAYDVATDGTAHWVAVGSGVWTSADAGETWEAPEVEFEATSVATDSKGTWVAVGYSGVWRSTDSGATWTQTATPVEVDANSVATDGTRFVAVGYEGSWFSDDHGITWTASPTSAISGDGRDVASDLLLPLPGSPP